ncbi:hypothetical protein PC110_g6006 [Phytophthora cactorum]|uniref:Uncharacterized protein n=1 Tax=Phytophthora cactorum TaxID=29920 RepID=A0A329SQ98_9STRA|nr:hypothetical protein PC110_g6006 [Phytophthora cactorum]
MPGLSASELPPETLHPGDTLEYYCHAFVFGERNSHRVAIVTMVDATEGAEYPVDVDTGDVITRAMMTKRLADRFGKPFIPEATKRQKLRTSRKRRDQAKCAITSSGSAIYHAKTVKAVKFKTLLSSPEVKRRLKNLRARRTTYPDPTAKEERELLQEIPWPAGIEEITTCKRNEVKFPDIGKFDSCECIGDYCWNVCRNVDSATFWTPRVCNLGARCSNASPTKTTLKLLDTRRADLVSTLQPILTLETS